jgi:hypothetical protein
LKQPNLPYFVVPHPMSSMSADALGKAADSIFDGVLTIVSSALASAEAVE